MLLCTAIINSTVHRFSDRTAKLEHPWLRKIVSFSSPTIDISKNYGGRMAISEGKITLSPDFTPYPPPMTIEMELRRWVSGETGTLLFNGTAYLDSYNHLGATYRLYAPSYTAEAASGRVLSGTIVTTFTAGAAALGLTLNSTGARSPLPANTYTTTRAALWTDLLASVAEFFCHIWWIDKEAGILYLRAIENENGSREVGREFFSPSYKYPSPTNEAMAVVGSTTYRQATTTGIGKTENVQAYTTTAANINAALLKILNTANTMETEVTIPIENGIPAPNEKIIAIDRKVTPNLQLWCLAQKFSFDFEKNTVTVSGKGGATVI